MDSTLYHLINMWANMCDNLRSVSLAYQTPVSGTFLSKLTSHQQSANNSIFLSAPAIS
jgi:hypothetical protein